MINLHLSIELSYQLNVSVHHWEYPQSCSPHYHPLEVSHLCVSVFLRAAVCQPEDEKDS